MPIYVMVDLVIVNKCRIYKLALFYFGQFLDNEHIIYSVYKISQTTTIYNIPDFLLGTVLGYEA